jgi:AI-2 transport protein TqsA
MNAEQTERKVEQTDRKVIATCQLILTVIASGVALMYLKPVLVPFCLALLLTYCLTPIIDLQTKYLRLPRNVAIADVGVAGVLVSLLLMYLTVETIGDVIDNRKVYRDEIVRLTDMGAAALDRFGIHPSAEEMHRILEWAEKAGETVFETLFGALTQTFTTGTLVVIFMIFILLGRRGPAADPTSLLGEIETRVRRYLVRLVFVSVLSGVLVGVILAALGVKFALVFGFLAFLLNFIPNVGSIIATLLPLPVVLLSPDLSVTTQILAIALPAAVQFLIGSIIQPRLYGGALDLHPVTVLLALVFFGMIWGIIGAFLAMPITAVIRIVFERIPTTRPLGHLMAGDLSFLSQPLKHTVFGLKMPEEKGSPLPVEEPRP